MTPAMDDPGAVFSRELLIDLAENDRVAPAVRAVMLAAERADAEGVARFDAGELAELLTVSRQEVASAIRTCATRGRFLPGSAPGLIRLNLSMIRPCPVLLPGQRHGSLALVRRTGENRWAVACECGPRSSWSESHLTYGLAVHTCSTSRATA